MSARVTFYTRAGCHLCDVAREVLQQVCADRPERIAVALEAHFTDWQGSERRRDDVTALCWSLDGARS